MHLFGVAFSKSLLFLCETVYPVHKHTYKQIYTVKNGLILHMKLFRVLCEGAMMAVPQDSCSVCYQMLNLVISRVKQCIL